MQSEQENRPFSKLLFEEANLLLKRADEAGPENADPTYTARTFHRLVEAWVLEHHPDNQQFFDIGAIALTAEEFFKKRNPFFGQVPMTFLMAHLMSVCLGQAFEEEQRRVVFPVWRYDMVPDLAEEELDDYQSGYDPLALHKFTQRVLTRGTLRVRGDDNEIIRAIWELNEAMFPIVLTREDFAKSLAEVDVEVMDWELAEFDRELAEQSQQTPEVVAGLLQKIRGRRIAEYTEVVFQNFMELGDHGIRCGISATLFLAGLYAQSTYAAAKGASEETIKRTRPKPGEIKQSVAAYFANWLIMPLPTKPRDGRKADYDLANLPLQEHFNYTYRETIKAKDFYKVVSRYKDCMNLVKREHPDMPIDLIQEFRLPDKCKGRDAYIAAEWAARLCDIDDWHYDGRTLSKHVSTDGLRKNSLNHKFPKEKSVSGKKAE